MKLGDYERGFVTHCRIRLVGRGKHCEPSPGAVLSQCDLQHYYRTETLREASGQSFGRGRSHSRQEKRPGCATRASGATEASSKEATPQSEMTARAG